VKATEILMQEHRLIEQVLDCLEEAACRLDDGEEIDAEFFIDAAEFVAGFADGSHHRKEEDILFVAMTAKDMPADSGPVAVMLHEHEEGRRLTAAFRSAAEQMKTGDTSAAMDVIQNVLDYVNLLREHIIKEDNVLFPMADQLVTGDDMRVVSRKFEQALAEDEASGEIKRYQELALKLSAALNTVEG
jgi:hemerythrin-like domain-containing protein